MVVLVSENPTADIIAARLFIRAGSRWESPALAGLSHLIAAVLTKGTERLSSFDIAEQVESVGASLSTDATTDYFLLSLKTVSSDFENLLTLAAELLRSPSFPEAELALERRLTLQAIRSQQEQPFTLAYDQLRRMMYADHPYALPGLGTEETVSRIQRDDLLHYHQQYFRPDNMVISLSGRFETAAAIALVERIFGGWQPPATALPTVQVPPVAAQSGYRAIAQETQQSILMLGYLAPSVLQDATAEGYPLPACPDYAVLKLLNTYLGNGLSSRLFVELREKRGLAYEVSAFYTTRVDAAQFVAYMGTAPDNTAIALDGLQSEIDRLCTTALHPDELDAAKNKLLGQYALGKQTNAQIAQLFGWYEILGLGIQFDADFQAQVAAVDAEIAQAVAQTYFVAPSISLIGPAAAVQPWVE